MYEQTFRIKVTSNSKLYYDEVANAVDYSDYTTDKVIEVEATDITDEEKTQTEAAVNPNYSIDDEITDHIRRAAELAVKKSYDKAIDNHVSQIRHQLGLDNAW